MKLRYYITPKGKKTRLGIIEKKQYSLKMQYEQPKTWSGIHKCLQSAFMKEQIALNEIKDNDSVAATYSYSNDNNSYDDSYVEDYFSPVSEMVDTSDSIYMEPITLEHRPVSSTSVNNSASNGKYGKYRRSKRPNPEEILNIPVDGKATPIMDIQNECKDIIIQGQILGLEVIDFEKVSLISFDLADESNSMKCKIFVKERESAAALGKNLKKLNRAKILGYVQADSKYERDFVFWPQAIQEYFENKMRTESRSDSRVELHLHTKMSDKDAIIDVKQLIKTIKDWGHPAVAITDHGVVQAFPDAQYIAAEQGVKIIYGVEGYLIEDETSKKRYHIIILAKNEVGLRNLYKLISLSHLQYFRRRPCMPRAIIEDHREGLILGSACEAGELIQAMVNKEPWEKVQEIAKFYDYLEIQPITNNMFLVRSEKVADEAGLIQLNKDIVRLGEELNKPVVATCDAHFLNPEDKIYREIIMTCSGYKDAHLQPELYLRTTDEMLEEFSYLGDSKAYEVVITNTRKINDSIDCIKPIPDGTYAPKIDGADDALIEMCYKKAKTIYGENLPDVVKERLDYELKNIIGHGFGVLYYIAHKLVTKSLKDGYLVGSRGSVGSSFVATMADITEVNPLPPHYYCKKCQYSEFFTDGSYAGGFDLPRKNCPNCNEPLHTDGHDIPFAIFMGFNGDKVPDIDLNFSGDYQAKAHKYTEELFGRDNVFRAGTIGTIAEKTAFGYAKKYTEVKGIQCRNGFVASLAQGMVKVKNTTGQHPGGIMVCPRDMDVHHFTPVQYPANKKDSGIITTHFDYHSIEGRMTKLDILGHDDPTIIKMLEDMTGVNAQTIPFDDPETLELFYSTNSLGLTSSDLKGDTVATLGIPEFGTGFVRQMLEDSKPKTFSELVRISGFSHGTNVWLDNAQTLITSGVCSINEAISTRDDIMNYLIQHNIEPLVSFSIMENVRKGRGIEKRNKQGEATTNYIDVLHEGKIPEWFIDSCLKISYLFPKAHAVAYVMMAFRIAWFKINYPLAFYASYFSIRAKAFDCRIMVGGLEAQEAEYKRIKSLPKYERSNKEDNMFAALEVSLEMAKRGFEFKQVDIWESDSFRFKIVDGKLLPPFIAVDGLGETVAEAIVAERDAKKFTSIADVQRRAKVSSTLIDLMTELGVFGELPDDEQMSLF